MSDVLGRTRTISSSLPDQDQHRNPYPAGSIASGLQASTSHCHAPEPEAGPAPLASKGKQAKGKPTSSEVNTLAETKGLS